ncbi:PHA/PHB synthase family protein [Aurantiacibacter spongiae]|nr:class I poly(R)-hydroxyalkanoic acid synthase [Aurantiacibacter spongiae]
MTDDDRDSGPGPGESEDLFMQMLRMQGESARAMLEAYAVDPWAEDTAKGDVAGPVEAMGQAMLEMQRNWLRVWLPDEGAPQDAPPAPLADPAGWMKAMQQWTAAMPMLDPLEQQRLWADGVQLWSDVLSQYAPGGETAPPADPDLPRRDKRFADKAWRAQPVFALIHQTYLLFAERLAESIDTARGLTDAERDNLRFATTAVLDAMSPANFPMMNPVVLERTMETGGENLVRGMERLATDLDRGQLTHSDSSQFVLGENVAATPGKVIHETPLFQLIQYSPTTGTVLETPLVIFPPWINRFYILDLNPKKSFVRWAVENGITVLMVSWKSADESLAHIEWDDYIAAQMEAIDVTRERLGVARVHAIGYCVAGTTLAATLAIMARREEAEKVASVTFFTAQVDFEHAGDLKLFVENGRLELARQAARGGYLDGRYMAATFNMLRGSDLIWNTVVNHYLLGEDYPAFDLLYWNGDVTNLPSRWHDSYLRDLYRDNKLVQPDALSAGGTPIDLSLIETPAYIQAGREDHIAPPESVFRLLDHLNGPTRFVLAGSGHIAGVVNPPDARKYQYWTNDGEFASLEEFVEGAEEHPGSWWPDWLDWLRGQDGNTLEATGARCPGGKENPALEDAPGRYVAQR